MPSVEERLAVVEVTVADIKSDVHDIKVDVKALLLRSAGAAAFTGLGKYLIPFMALVLSTIALVRGG
jgi:hypothetical protein